MGWSRNRLYIPDEIASTLDTAMSGLAILLVDLGERGLGRRLAQLATMQERLRSVFVRIRQSVREILGGTA